MRVALVLQKLIGLRGGAERVVVDLAHALVERGHQVSILTYEPSVGSPGYDVGDIPVVDLFPPWMRTLLSRSADLNNADSGRRIEHALSRSKRVGIRARGQWEITHGYFARRLAGWLDNNPHDVVVGFLPPAISAVAFAGKRMGDARPRLIASTHNLPELDFGDSPRWDQNPIARERNLWALSAVDAVTVLQPEFIEQLPEDVRNLAVVMPNAVRRLGPESEVAREDLILGVGRLTDVKRFDILIKAFARIADDHPSWRVEIYGDGPERDLLLTLTEAESLGGRVSLPGTVADIGREYDRARILCHPAEYEGFGLSVAEALLHRTFVVASGACVGVNRLVDDGVNGMLVEESGDAVGAFAAALSDAAARSETVLPAASVESIRRRLSPQSVYDRWERLLIG